MIRLHDMRRWVRQSTAPMVCLTLVAYFAYHAVQGERGIVAHNRMSQEIALAENALAEAKAKRLAIEKRVMLLRPDGIDRDLLDERARRTLGMAHPDELVIYLD